MGFTYDNQGTNTYLVYEIGNNEIDSMSLGMLTNNEIPGFAAASFTQMDSEKYIRYNVSAKISVAQLFEGPVNKKRLLGVFNGIIEAMSSAEEYMLDIDTILLDLDYIFTDVTTCETVLVCLPVVNSEFKNPDLSKFFKNIIFNTQFDQTENCDHVATILNYLNSTPVLILDNFKELLNRLREEKKEEKKEVKKAEPVVQKKVQQEVPRNEEITLVDNYYPSGGTQIETAIERKVVSPVNPVVLNEGGYQSVTNLSPAPQVAEKDRKRTFWGLFGQSEKKNTDTESKKKKEKKKKEPNVSKLQKETKQEGQKFAIPGQAPQVPTGGMAIPGKQPAVTPVPTPAAKTPPVQTPPVKNVQTPPVYTPPVTPAPANTPPVYTPPVSNYQQYTQQQVSGGTPLNFGETTVLGGGAIGETTVLGGAVEQVKNDPHLIRVKNNERIPLNKPVFRIGKEKSYVDYFIGDNTAVSRSHANIINHNGEFFVVDTNSTNHTYVNGVMIHSNVETKLSHGAKLRLANEEFEFRKY